ATSVGAFGGLMNTTQTPWWPNPEVIRALQFTPDRSIDEVLQQSAARWVGEEHAAALVDFWTAIDEAVSYIPLVPLYGGFGFPWYRTWIRPLVPNLEAVPKEERGYYLDFMVTVCNNPMNVDLGRDVLFELFGQEAGQKMADNFDAHVLPRLRASLAAQRVYLETITENIDGDARAVFIDLIDRT